MVQIFTIVENDWGQNVEALTSSKECEDEQNKLWNTAYL